jgi:hypothetical protein
MVFLLVLSVSTTSTVAFASTIRLSCVYQVQQDPKPHYDVLKETDPVVATFINGTYLAARPVYVEALGTCAERADANTVIERRQYFVVGLAGYETGVVWNGRYYPVFHSDPAPLPRHHEIDFNHPDYLKGQARQKAADTLYPKGLILTHISEHMDTFANAYLPQGQGGLAHVPSVSDVNTKRTGEDIARNHVIFDVFSDNHFSNKYLHFLNDQNVCEVSIEGQALKKCDSQEQLELSLPTSVLMEVLQKAQCMNANECRQLVQNLRFAFDTRFRTQEFETVKMLSGRTQKYEPPNNSVVIPNTDGVRRHDFVLKGDRLILHTEVEYMFNHISGVDRLGAVVTVRAQRVMVFDLKKHRSTNEYIFIGRE